MSFINNLLLLEINEVMKFLHLPEIKNPANTPGGLSDY